VCSLGFIDPRASVRRHPKRWDPPAPSLPKSLALSARADTEHPGGPVCLGIAAMGPYGALASTAPIVPAICVAQHSVVGWQVRCRTGAACHLLWVSQR
jgi:hypothetical protein